MLAYAPPRQRQRLSPTALTLIVAGHLAAIAALMNARTDYQRSSEPPLVIDIIPLPRPPDPLEPPPPSPAAPRDFRLDSPVPIVPPLPAPGPLADPTPQPLPQPGPGTGPAIAPTPAPLPPQVRTGPRFTTPDAAIRPPYPLAKRESGEEASLRLRLAIDQRGRVVAVDPVGKADPVFLDAARRHILRAWRYRPAMEGERAVPSSTIVTLKFELG